jgi:glycosyltransferase involved in cell wall biosynthesis
MADQPLLFASYSGVLGGAERVLLDCVTRLEREITVACPEGPLAAALRQAGIAHVPIKERPLKLSPAHAGGIAGLALELRRRKPEFIVAWGARAVLATALTGRRWLAVHHDLLASPAVLGTVRATTKRANGVAAASHAIARQFKGDITVLHPGVDLTRFTPQPLPEGPPHALVLGALVPWKRPDLALEIAKHMPELRVTIAGATLPGDDGRLERTLGEAERITLAGAIDDVPRALANAHLLLHCADAEPYGMVLVEALAAGRPVVAPAAGGPLEIVADGAGRLYPPGDAQAAADAIRAVLADPQAPANARRRAEEHFEVTQSVSRLERAIAQATK